jgi:predicted transglutaminase-like cysteine proteinase
MVGRGLAALVALAWMAAPAFAAPPLVGKGEAPPLAAWTGYCDRHPAECAINVAEPDTITATPETLELIEAVNRYVNRTIVPITDQERWGIEDLWDYPADLKGDCEDIQLLKRKLLAEAGLPFRAMRMTVVINELGEGHAVLTLRMNGDDLILDNRSNDILHWNETGYAFIKRESTAPNATGWVFVEPEPTAPVMATAVAQ